MKHQYFNELVHDCATNKYRKERLLTPGQDTIPGWPRLNCQLTYLFSANEIHQSESHMNVMYSLLLLCWPNSDLFLGSLCIHSQHPFDALSQVFIDINTFSFIIRHYSNNWIKPSSHGCWKNVACRIISVIFINVKENWGRISHNSEKFCIKPNSQQLQ